LAADVDRGTRRFVNSHPVKRLHPVQILQSIQAVKVFPPWTGRFGDVAHLSSP